MEAIGQGNPTMARWLLEKGANPNIHDENNISPLEWACLGGYTDENNEELNAEYGSSDDYQECAKILVQHGAHSTHNFIQFGHIGLLRTILMYASD